MVLGPVPEDRTYVGGQPSSFNTTDPPANDTAPTPDPTATGSERYTPMEQHSPTQVHVPAWKTIVIGGSGGITVRGYYRD